LFLDDSASLQNLPALLLATLFSDTTEGALIRSSKRECTSGTSKTRAPAKEPGICEYDFPPVPDSPGLDGDAPVGWDRMKKAHLQSAG
jgi:hypothetical protein